MGARAIVASYADVEPLRKALGQLHAAGVERDDIALLMANNDEHAPKFGLRAGRKWAEGAAYGAALGGVLGGVLAGLIGLVAGGGIDPVTSELGFAALVGIGLGGGFGSLLGALVGMRVPTYEAKLSGDSSFAGKLMIGVWVSDEDRAQRVTQILAADAGC